jgi:hypothetical protein
MKYKQVNDECQARLLTLQSILAELAQRGHRLRYPDCTEDQANQVCDILPRNSDRAQKYDGIGDVCDSQSPKI